MDFIALISCVSKKQNIACPAQDLYISVWFKKARFYVESHNLSWYILSAKHGLLAPDELISPYEQTLYTMTSSERQEWSLLVYQRFSELCSTGTRVQIFAGQKYRQYLLPLLKQSSYEVQVPLQGLGIGKQLSWFNANSNL